MHLVVSFSSLNPALLEQHADLLTALQEKQCPEALQDGVVSEVLAGLSPTYQQVLRQRMQMALSWKGVLGVVALNPDMLRLEVRLKSSSMASLQEGCADVVAALLNQDNDLKLKVDQDIVLHGGDPAVPLLVGKVSLTTSWRLAFQEESRNTSILKWGLSLVVLLQVLTFPQVAHRIFALLDAETYQWVNNFLGRLASAAMFGSFLAFMNIRGRKKAFRRTGLLVWRPLQV